VLDEQWRDALRAADAARCTEPALIEHVEAAIARGALASYAADLVLAYAASHGDAAALRRFEGECGGEIVAAARKVDRAPAFVDEIAQRVRVRLLVGDGAAPPRLASYRGTGPLRAWVAIASLRVALNAKRDDVPAADDVLADVVDREPNPELRHMKELYRAEFRDALAAALSELPDRSRALLRLRHVDALELAEIGKLYAVHASTVSRWIADANADVASAARKRLVAKLALAPSAIDSVARMVASQLDLSIARLLR
jgi:RNA polymerase sigma-70 factor (ECF subfamily)